MSVFLDGPDPEKLQSKSKVPVLAAKFAGLYFSHFIFLGVLLPFFSGWLALRGFSAPAIGVINGIALILRLVCGPLVAMIADRSADKRGSLLVVTYLFALCAVMLVAGNNHMVIAIASVGIIWCFGLIVPLTDSMVLRADRNGFLNFGQVRAVGSIAFLMATILGGMYLRTNGFDMVAPILAASAIIAVLVTALLPSQIDQQGTPQEQAGQASIKQSPRKQATFWRDAVFLMVHPVFIVALLAAGMTQGAHAVYYAYSVLHWTDIGYSPFLIGWLWACGVIAEIVLLSFARPIARRLGVPLLLAIGGTAAAIRWMVTAQEPSLSLLFSVQMLHALTFGAAYLGAVEFIDRAVPVRFVNTGMVLFSTTGVGAITGLATVLAGFVFEDGGAKPAYLMMSFMGGCAIVLSVLLARLWNGEKLAA